MLECIASAVSNTVGIEASFSTTFIFSKNSCFEMYFDNIIKLHIIVINGPPSSIFLGRIPRIYIYIYILYSCVTFVNMCCICS